jgi:hypothetical protein
MFTLPMNGEAGGVASGTEDYYSFDYGDIHFVCLDSMTSARTAGSPMLTWLQADLAANTKKWLIAFWHHPPYSKGSHNSDTDPILTEMRVNALPILEAYGVDLVLSGHSHSYERSYLIDGHYGLSSTFNDSMKKNGGDGRPTGNGAYSKATLGPGAHEGAVYAVAGSSGKISGGTLNHPAMFISLNNLGSMALDVDGNQLDAKFIRENGVIADSFTITKGSVSNVPPSVNITAPANGATYTEPATINITANASDSDGTVSQVDFYQGATWLGTDTTSPYSFSWTGVPAGAYTLTAKATDNSGAETTSGGINVSVNTPVPPSVNITAPANGATYTAPATINITANASDTDGVVTKVDFYQGTTWLGTDSSSPYSFSWTGVTAGAYTLTAKATDNSGLETTSLGVNVTVNPPPATPTAPTGLTATAVSTTQINLSWTDNSSDELGFKIERSNNGVQFTEIATVGPNVTTYSSGGLQRNKTFYYRVRAYNAAGNSAYSNTANAKTFK